MNTRHLKAWVLLGSILGALLCAQPLAAQVVPDQTLPAGETSRVTGNSNFQIDGGARLGGNLFHSFSQFSVPTGGSAYFNNAPTITNIFTRITGGSISNIDGVIRANGTANLFLLNPNGILFSPNARLNIGGSFVASTGDRFQFADGSSFSAVNPQAPPLLTVNVTPGLQYGTSSPNATIVNQGNLAVAQDLTLSANRLELQGQLQAGRDLSLLAQDTVQVRDRAVAPFLAQAGRNLTIQGNQGIDILALNHPSQPSFVSGSNLSLLSDGVISGDAHFASGDRFSIASVSGGLANFVSYYDPIISARGDVYVAANYTGASLLVESQGNIRFGGNIMIAGPDTSALPLGPDTQTLGTSSALILRSGQSALAYGGTNSGRVPTSSSTAAIPTGITLGGNVVLQPFNGAGGIVRLIAGAGNVSTRAISTNGGAIHITSAGSMTSNQQPLDTSNGANDGGSITVSANGDISTGTITSSSSNQGNSGNGGDITLSTTKGNISIGFTRTFSSSSSSSGRGGDVTVSTANGSIMGEFIFTFSSSDFGSADRGGNITLTAANGNIIPGRLYSDSFSTSGGAGNGGIIVANTTNGNIEADRIISTSQSTFGRTASNGGEIALSVTNGNIITSSINSGTTLSIASTPSTGSGTAGNGGAITLTAVNGNISTERLDSSVIALSDAGNGGAIKLVAPNGSITAVGYLYSGSFSTVGRGGRGGNITLIAGGTIQPYDLSLSPFDTINSTGALGSGNITIDTQSPFALPNFLITSDTFGAGRGGDIQITAPSISLTNGSQISASTHSSGQGGNITLRASDYIQMSGATTTSPFGTNFRSGFAGLPPGTYVGGYIPTGANPSPGTLQSPAGTVFPSGAFTQTTVGATGSAGNLSIETGRLIVQDGAALATTTFGQNSNAGSISIRARDSVSLANGRILSGVAGGAIGNSGGITIDTPSLVVTGGIIQTQTLGQGQAGDIQITAPNAVNLSGIDSGVLSGSGGSNTLLGTTGNNIGQGGNIRVTTGTLNVTDGATLNAQTQTNSRGGDITVNARSLSLTNGGQLTANTNFGGSAGNISIAADTIGLAGVGTSGASSGIFTATSQTATGQGGELRVNANTLGVSDGAVLSARTGGSGRGGDIFVNANTINLTSGGELVTTTSGGGRAGNIEVTAGDRLSISGSDPAFATRQTQFPNTSVDPVSAASGLFTNTEVSASGAGGNIKVRTDTLSVVNGGQLVAATTGRGDAGNIAVNATGAINVAGVSSTGNRSGLFTATEQTATGRGGEIQVNSDRLGISDGAVLSARSSSSGRGGDITVSADTVDLSGGGQLLTTASGSGRAGDIMVKTPDLQLIGATSGLFAGTTSSGDAGNLTIQPRGNGQSVRVNLQSGAQISASTSSSGHGGQLTITAPESITLTGDGSIIAAGTGGSGTGGNLNLQTGTLNIQNRAQVTVSSSGTGSAGSLFVDANRILLDNAGRIRADTTGGGGDLNLRSPLILLRHGSNITTNAKGSNIPGGNIGIDTRFLVAVKRENSDISANSEDFRGGNVSINAYSIFGIQPRPFLTPLSDITATGATSALAGTINVNTVGIDPTAGLVALPTDLVDPSRLVAQGCPASKGNSFVVTGRGGLPPTPEQQLDDDAGWLDRRRLVVAGHKTKTATDDSSQQSTSRLRSASTSSEVEASNGSPNTPHTPQTAIIEATGWQMTPTGKVILVATTSLPIHNTWHQPVGCDGRQ